MYIYELEWYLSIFFISNIILFCPLLLLGSVLKIVKYFNIIKENSGELCRHRSSPHSLGSMGRTGPTTESSRFSHQ